MPRFDVHRDRDGLGYLLDCQADLLSDFGTRFVVQLLPVDMAVPTFARLNPIFDVEGQPHVMQTQLAAAVSRSRLGPVVMSLATRDYTISNSLDVLLTGV